MQSTGSPCGKGVPCADRSPHRATPTGADVRFSFDGPDERELGGARESTAACRKADFLLTLPAPSRKPSFLLSGSVISLRPPMGGATSTTRNMARAAVLMLFVAGAWAWDDHSGGPYTGANVGDTTSNTFSNMQNVTKNRNIALAAGVLPSSSTRSVFGVLGPAQSFVLGNVTELALVWTWIDRKYATGQESTIPWEKLPPRVALSWAGMIGTMNKLFYGDYCGQVWNDETQGWYTCCQILTPGGPAAEFGYCGSNLALSIPAPCRAPVFKQDFGELTSSPSFNGSTAPARPTDGNVGIWSCSASVGAARAQPVKAALTTSHAKPSKSRFASTPAPAPMSQYSAPNTARSDASIPSRSSTGNQAGSESASNAAGQDALAQLVSQRAEDFMQVIKIQDVPFTIEVVPVAEVSKNYCGSKSASINSCYTLCWWVALLFGPCCAKGRNSD
jgi:hypothetical protein